MKIYLAWSGETSRELAQAFQAWISQVIQQCQVFFSPADIEKGTRWASEISHELSNCSAGLLFLTSENLDSRWLHFEAGALSKSFETSRVVPILYNVETTQVQYPLAQFQSIRFNKDEVFELVRTANKWQEENQIVASAVLEVALETFWPRLDALTKTILENSTRTQEPRAPFALENTVKEILEIVRLLAEGSASSAESLDIEDTYPLNTRVRHSTRGPGTVVRRFVKGAQQYVSIKFDSGERFKYPIESDSLSPLVSFTPEVLDFLAKLGPYVPKETEN